MKKLILILFILLIFNSTSYAHNKEQICKELDIKIENIVELGLLNYWQGEDNIYFDMYNKLIQTYFDICIDIN